MLYDLALEASLKFPESVSFAETGTRSGHSAMVILKAINDSGKKRWLFTIDPYGDKPYGVGQVTSRTYDYGEQHYRNAMHSLSRYAWENDLLHHHYRMRSQEYGFMAENVEFWHGGDIVGHRYGFVYLDGEHTVEAINSELAFFLPRLEDGGAIVIDDIAMIGDRIGELSVRGEIINDKYVYKK